MNANAQLLQEVIAAFNEIPGLNYSRLYIDVQSEIVTIRGRMLNGAQRLEAERVARLIVGPRSLVIELGVAPAPMVNEARG